MGKQVVVQALPKCDMCKDGKLARYDAKTHRGPWANMCDTHFFLEGIGVGTGLGQYLLLPGEEAKGE